MSLAFGFHPTQEPDEIVAPDEEPDDLEVEFLAVPVTLFAADLTPPTLMPNPWNDFAPVLATVK